MGLITLLEMVRGTLGVEFAMPHWVTPSPVAFGEHLVLEVSFMEIVSHYYLILFYFFP